MLPGKEIGEADLKGTMFEAPGFVKHDLKHEDHHQLMNMEDHNDVNMHDDDVITTSESSSSIGDCSITSLSSSSSDLVDDASSPSSTSCNGPLFELSELTAQLPIKRGLSKYYRGKSQSFRSLSSVKTVADLAKKETPFYRKKMKASKRSRGRRSDAHKLYTLPRSTISKKVSTNNSFMFFRQNK